MLADPRAEAMIDNFAGQCAGHPRARRSRPRRRDVPRVRRAARGRDARRDAPVLPRAFLLEDIPLDQPPPDFTYMNDRLAARHGMRPPGTSELVRVSLEGTPRRGLVTQGSYPDRRLAPAPRPPPVKRWRSGCSISCQCERRRPPPRPPCVEGSAWRDGPRHWLRSRSLEQHRKTRSAPRATGDDRSRSASRSRASTVSAPRALTTTATSIDSRGERCPTAARSTAPPSWRRCSPPIRASTAA